MGDRIVRQPAVLLHNRAERNARSQSVSSVADHEFRR
jgi:hypothetical protein